MKKLLFLLPLISCGPYAASIDFAIGANQTLDKTIKINQRQTTAQTDAQVSFWEDLFKVLPIFAAPQPTPTPTPIVKSITLNLVEPTPTPGYVIREWVKETKARPRPKLRIAPTPCPPPNNPQE